MNEINKMEQRIDVLMRALETNSKKIRQAKLKTQTYDIRRIEANQRIMNELCQLASLVNEIWEHPDREQIVGS